jgi:methylated-DNA-[protein]-cysteine S-methyltransferase
VQRSPLAHSIAEVETEKDYLIGVIGSQFGPIHLAVTQDAVLGLELLTTEAAFARSVARRLRMPAVAPGEASRPVRRMLDRALAGIGRYLDGDPGGLDLPVEIVGRSPWDLRVLDAVRAVPWGAVTSYGRVARRAGSPGAARAAGGAVGRNPLGLLVPCHRVIAGDGTLGGYGGSWSGDRDALLDLKRDLLAHEGIRLPVDRFV